MIYALDALTPQIHPDAFIAPDALVIGNVTIHKNASVWWRATLRGDVDAISIGENTNIQDAAVLHMNKGAPLVLGQNITVGHNAILHGCTIGDGSLIGMGAILLTGSMIGAGSLVGAGALVPEGKTYPDGALIVGSPAKAIRILSYEEQQKLLDSAEAYVQNAARYRQHLRLIS